VFHLGPERRAEAGFGADALRSTVCADLASGEDRGLEYVPVTVTSLDLSSLAFETPAMRTLTFRNVTVEETLGLSESRVGLQTASEGCTIGRLDAMDCASSRTSR
jgi:hypothetical protein